MPDAEAHVSQMRGAKPLFPQVSIKSRFLARNWRLHEENCSNAIRREQKPRMPVLGVAR
jgi:hypothetical protein